MLPTASLFFRFLLFAVGIAANSVVIRQGPVSLPLARHINITGSNDLVQKDRARAKNLVANIQAIEGRDSPGTVVSVGVTSVGIRYEVTSASVTLQPIVNTLVIDTGSSVTWLGAGKPYVKTKSSMQTSNDVFQSYGSSSTEFYGTEFIDTVTIAPGLVIPRQSIGVASKLVGFKGFSFDGILGIGPVDLTLGALSPAVNSTIPTIIDNLFSQGPSHPIFSQCPSSLTTTSPVKNGELTFGGTDQIPLPQLVLRTGSGASTSPSGTVPRPLFSPGLRRCRHWKRLHLIATDAFNRYRAATGAVLDSTTGLLRITPAQYSNLKSLFSQPAARRSSSPKCADLASRVNELIGGTSQYIYLIIHDIGTPSGQGLDFLNGSHSSSASTRSSTLPSTASVSPLRHSLQQ
ncbi:aspartic peptidase domain-containing protein [Lactifluus volemus]|nr:aspartic peptidase domain-containing protein [Lactifluus volemus]